MLIHLLFQFLSQRSNPFPLYSAGNDIIEIRQVGIDIEGKSVHGYPPAGSDTHGTYLSSKGGIQIQPHSCFTVTSRSVDPKIGQGFDDDLLQTPQVAVDISKKIIQIQKRVAYDLPRAVESDVAPTIVFKKRNAYA